MQAPSDEELGVGSPERLWVLSDLERMYAKRGEKWSGAGVSRFPGTSPISVTSENLAQLRAVPHIVFPKDDGWHFILLFTRVSGAPRTFAVARNLRIFALNVAAPSAFFEGTCVEGELLPPDAEGRCRFALFKALWIAGEDLRASRFVARHALLRTFFPFPAPSADRAAEHPGSVVSRHSRLFFDVKAMRPASTFLDIMAEERATCDGVILVPDCSDHDVVRKRFVEIKVKHVDTVDLAFRASRLADGRTEVSVNCVCGDELLDMFREFRYGEEDVYVQLERTPLLSEWVRRRKGELGPGERVTDVIECRVRLLPLTEDEITRIREKERAVRGRRRGRDWRRKLVVEPERLRPDKGAANRLHVIVSTLAQSSCITPEMVKSAMYA